MAVKSLSNIYSSRRLDVLHVTPTDSYHHVTCDRGAPLCQAWTLEHRELSYWSRSWVGANQLAAWVHTAVSVPRGSVRLLHTMVKPGSNLCGLSPQVFWLIPFYFSEIRLFYKRHLNILQGFCRVTAINTHYKTKCLTSTAYSATSG